MLRFVCVCVWDSELGALNHSSKKCVCVAVLTPHNVAIVSPSGTNLSVSPSVSK